MLNFLALIETSNLVIKSYFIDRNRSLLFATNLIKLLFNKYQNNPN